MKKNTTQKNTKKLMLAKETVRELRGADLERAAGAYINDRTITSISISWEESAGC